MPSASPRSQASDGACSSDQGEPARPERLGQPVRHRRAGSRPARPRVEASPISTGTGIVRPRFLAASSPVDGGRGERVGGDAVDRVGGQQHQLAAADGGGGGVETGGAGVGVGAVVEVGHGAAVFRSAQAERRAVVNRGRPARSGWSSTSVNAPCARTSAGSALALLVGVLDAEPAARVAAAARR